MSSTKRTPAHPVYNWPKAAEAAEAAEVVATAAAAVGAALAPE